MHLGFIGLGHLGKAIAGRLLACGHTLTVWNRTPSRAEGMQVEVVSSPRAVVDKADIIFLCLFDSKAVHAVLSQEDGILSGDISGKIIVDVSTNHFREVPVFHELCEKAGGLYMEAPVLGSVVPAAQGALTVLISGNTAGYEQVKPVLENIGKHLFYLQNPGLATKMKLINNLALGSFMATIAEALSIGETAGMKKEEILEILAVGGGNSLVLNAKKDKLLKEDFSTHFSSALIYKDLHCLQDLACEQKQPLFTGAVIKELYARTFEQGIEQEDFSAIYKVFKKG
jgi:3-hydroxyisobutyrate dehydrogenase